MGNHFRTPLFVILIAGLALVVSAPSSFAQNPDSAARLSQLREKAWSAGQVHVIVHFVVPDIEILSDASARFTGPDQTADAAGAMVQADAALTNAIEYSSWKILTELQGTDCKVISRFAYLPFIVLEVSPQALAVLENSPDVLGIEEDALLELADAAGKEGNDIDAAADDADDDPLDPMLDDTVTLIGAKAAWDMGFTGKGWYVAVMDTGIRPTHQFFSGKNIIEACRAKGADGSSPEGDCPNGTWTQDGPGSAVHYPSSYTGYDHGTHVAGIATGNYGALAGIAKDADIIAVKVFSKVSGGLTAWFSDLVAGLEYVYSLRGSYKIASANMSLGGIRFDKPCDSLYAYIKAPIALLSKAGIASAIATGNNYVCGEISVPACVSNSVAVGSSTKADERSNFSNYHPTMQKLFAPGSSIYSSTGVSDSSYASWNGTSMATPHVAGAWAVLKQAMPKENVANLLKLLRATGKSVSNDCVGAAIPRIQIDAALKAKAKFTLTTAADPVEGGTAKPAKTTSYPWGKTVTLRATAKKGYLFSGWSGDATGIANPATITIDGNKSVTAHFTAGTALFAPVLTAPADGAAGIGASATLEWTDTNSSPQEKKFLVRIKKAGGEYTYIVVAANKTSYVVNGLTAGTTYSWSVQAMGPTAAQNSEFPADWTFTTAN